MFYVLFGEIYYCLNIMKDYWKPKISNVSKVSRTYKQFYYHRASHEADDYK